MGINNMAMTTNLTRTPPISIDVADYERFKVLAKDKHGSISSAIRDFIKNYGQYHKISSKHKSTTKAPLPYEQYIFDSKDTGVDSSNYKESLYK